MALSFEDKDKLLYWLNTDFFGDDRCFKVGRRNDDAVDFCIISWCLGYNPVDKFNELAAQHKWDESQYDVAREHIDRIVPYLSKWGTKGTIEAMDYAINY